MNTKYILLFSLLATLVMSAQISAMDDRHTSNTEDEPDKLLEAILERDVKQVRTILRSHKTPLKQKYFEIIGNGIQHDLIEKECFLNELPNVRVFANSIGVLYVGHEDNGEITENCECFICESKAGLLSLYKSKCLKTEVKPTGKLPECRAIYLNEQMDVKVTNYIEKKYNEGREELKEVVRLLHKHMGATKAQTKRLIDDVFEEDLD